MTNKRSKTSTTPSKPSNRSSYRMGYDEISILLIACPEVVDMSILTLKQWGRFCFRATISETPGEARLKFKVYQRLIEAGMLEDLSACFRLMADYECMEPLSDRTVPVPVEMKQAFDAVLAKTLGVVKRSN